MENFSSSKKNRGVALILTILLMSLVLFLSLYLLNFALTEDKISHSQAWGAKTYYLAEAGIQEMVWRLKNDAAYKQNFETNPNWTANFTRDNPFGADNGSYTVSITNSSLAHGVIASTGTINIGAGKTSQRIVKTYVYRATGQSGVQNNSGYADGNIDISSSVVNFHGGSAHSNNNFNVNGASTVNIDIDLNATGNYLESQFSTVSVGGAIHSANNPPAAAAIAMPAVDFDSSDPNSYKNRAAVVYSENEFENLLKNNQNLTLSGPITYVTGEVKIKGAQNLTINGLLVVEEIEEGESNCWQGRCGNNTITVNHTVGQPAGILSKKKIEFGYYTGTDNASGAIYANDQLNIVNIPTGRNFNVTGGLIGRKLTITSAWQPLNINYDNLILAEALGATEFSPIIMIEHWEEEY